MNTHTALADSNPLHPLDVEVTRLRSILEEVAPFVISDVLSGLRLGPPPSSHITDSCDDCMWYAESLSWASRILNGDLGEHARTTLLDNFDEDTLLKNSASLASHTSNKEAGA